MEITLPQTSRTWQIKEARAQFSTLVEKAMTEGPQLVTRRGKKAVIVVSAAEWGRRNSRRGDLVEFFANSPLREEAVEIERVRDYPRETEF